MLLIKCCVQGRTDSFRIGSRSDMRTDHHHGGSKASNSRDAVHIDSTGHDERSGDSQADLLKVSKRSYAKRLLVYACMDADVMDPHVFKLSCSLELIRNRNEIDCNAALASLCLVQSA